MILTPSPCLSHSNYTKVSIPLHINIFLQSYRPPPPPPSIPHSQANLHITMATDKHNTLHMLWTMMSESSTNSGYVPGRLDGAPGPFQTHGGSHTSAIGSPEPRTNNQSISTQQQPGFHTEGGGGHPGISPPPEKIDGNIISIMNVDVHYRKWILQYILD